MIRKYVDSLDSIRKSIREEIIRSKDDPEKVKLTDIFTILTRIVETYQEKDEETKLTDGTERYHR